MRSWKRRTRGIRKMHRKAWFYSYLHQGVKLRKVYTLMKKDRLRISRDLLQRKEAVRAEAEGKTHYEDCFYHPCIITVFDVPGDDIQGISLVDGTGPRSCSLLNCGVVFFTEEEAIKRADYIKEHGFEKYYEHPDFENYDLFEKG